MKSSGFTSSYHVSPTGDVPAAASLIESEPTDVEWNSAEQTARLISMMSPAHLAKIEAARKMDEPQVGFLYRRTREGSQRAEVRFDGVAGCLRTPYGGSSRQTVVIVDGGAIRSRLLSSREAARLMGAGDDYRLPPGYNDAYRAMGDAVAVPAAKWLSDHLLLPLVDVVNASFRAQSPKPTINRHRAIAEGMASEWSQNANHLPPQPNLMRR